MNNGELPILDAFKGDDAKLIESAKALISLSDSGSLAPHGIGGHARTILSAFIVRTESALALSRGVPAGMVLVPRKLTSDMADAYMRLFTGTERFSAERMWDGLLAAAPAAAGAQGEVAYVTIDFPQVGTAGPFKVINGRMTLPDVTMNDLIHHARTGYVPAPQPAAADGGVRERARELLAQQFDSMNPLYADCIRKASPTDIDDSPHVDAALRAISAALSSHRQAGDDLSEFRELAEEWKAHAKKTRQEAEEETSEVMYYANRHEAAAYSGCAYALLALVEKGAGNGQ